MSADGNPDPFERGDGTELDQLRAEVAALKEVIAVLRSEISVMRSKIEGVDDIQGDENVAPSNGFVEVDRTSPKHPVIRFLANRLPDGGGGKEYIAGDDTNIVFTPDENDSNKVKVDVYYL